MLMMSGKLHVVPNSVKKKKKVRYFIDCQLERFLFPVATFSVETGCYMVFLWTSVNSCDLK